MEQRAVQFDFQWVEIGASFQWREFLRTIEILQSRGNSLFVLVGPFNEHVLTEKSLMVYRERQRAVAAILRDRGIPYAMPPALPEDLYTDASHPTSEGYASVARWLMRNEAFTGFDARVRAAEEGSPQ